MSWKERLLRSLPYVFVILSAAGVVITEELWLSLVALMGMWLLPSPLPVSSDVSRETLTLDDRYSSQWGRDNLPPLVGMSEEKLRESHADTIPAPCVVMHGSAEPHVEGCEGWTLGR